MLGYVEISTDKQNPKRLNKNGFRYVKRTDQLLFKTRFSKTGPKKQESNGQLTAPHNENNHLQSLTLPCRMNPSQRYKFNIKDGNMFQSNILTEGPGAKNIPGLRSCGTKMT